MVNRRALIGSLLACSLLVGTPLLADPRERGGRERQQEPETGDYVDLDSAVSRVRERTGGRILSAQTKGSNGNTEHVIRVMTDDGKVRRIRVEARSGRLK